MEFEWRWLQRLRLWDTRDQFFIGCLHCATRGAFTTKR
jgi:hypothetical protein